MTDADGNGDKGVPDSDPEHLDPAGDVADLVEANVSGIDLDEDTDAEDLRAFIDAVESGEHGPADPGMEATVRIARALLENVEADGESDKNAEQ